MTKCIMCNQDGYVGRLCYLHVKYYQGLTGPHFNTLYDLLWWKATFLKKWKLHFRTLAKIPITCDDHVHIQKMNKNLLLTTKLKVEFALANKEIDLSSFSPLMHKLANRFSNVSDHSADDLFQQCTVWLQDMTRNVDQDMEPKMLTTWIKKSLYGLLYNFTTRQGGVVKRGETTFLGDIEEHVYDSDARNQEQLLMDKEFLAKVGTAIGELVSVLNDRQKKIVLNWYDADTLTPKEFALAHGISKQMYSKDVKTIMTKAEALNV
jgi:RNA polymerase sigma factor (sigma-70 family)